MADFKLDDVLYDIPENLIDQFKLQNPNAIAVDPGKKKPSQKEEPGAAVEETVAPQQNNTELQSANGSLEQRLKEIKDEINILTGSDGQMEALDSDKRKQRYSELASEYNDLISTTEFDKDLKYTGVEPIEELYKGSEFQEDGAKLRQSIGGGFQPLELEEVVITGKDKSAEYRKKIEAEDQKNRLKVLSNLSNIPEFAISTTAGIAATTVDIVSGFLNLLNKYGTAPVSYALGKALGYNTTLEAEAMASVGNFEALDEVSSLLNSFTIKKYDSEGNEEDIISLIQKDDYSNAAELAFSQGFSAAPYLALSIMSPVYGSALIGMSVTGQEIERDLKERTDASLAEIYGASAAKGGIEFLTNLIGGGLQRGVLGIGKKLGFNSSAYNKAVDIYTKTYLGKVADVGLGLTKAGAVNFLEEASASYLSALSDSVIYNDSFEHQAAIRQAINEGLVGLALGAPIGGAGGFRSIATKGEALRFIAPKTWKKDYAEASNKLAVARKDLSNAPESTKEYLQQRVDRLEKIVQRKEQLLQDSFDQLTTKEKSTYAENLSKIDKSLKIIGNKKYSKEAQQDAQKILDEAAEQNQNLVGKTLSDAEVEKSISKVLKNSEILEDAFSKSKDIKEIKVKKLSKEDFNNLDNQFKKSNGFFDPDTNTIYINMDVASAQSATNVIGHELLHYIMYKNFKTDNASLEPIVEDFKQYLQKTHPEIYTRVQERINDNYMEIDPETGQKVIKKGALEEYFNVFADLISKEKITVNESLLEKAKNSTTRFLNGLGFGAVKIETGKDMFNFIRNYQKNISNFKFKQLGVDLKSSKIPKAIVNEVESQRKESRTESSNKVQEIYDKQGVAGAMDIIDQFGPIVNKLVNKYRDVPGFEFDLLKDEIQTGKRGILDMIMDYSPEKAKGAPLAAYINKFLPARMIEIANRNLDTEFALDVTEAKGVADTSTTETIIEEKEAAVAEEIKKVTLSEGLDASRQVGPIALQETVSRSLEKAVALSVKKYNEQISKNRTVTPFIQSIKENLAKDLRKAVKAFINSYPGGYEKFLQDKRVLLLNNFTTTYLSKHPLFKKGIQKSSGGIKSIDAEGRAIFNANFVSPTRIEKNKFDWVDEKGKKLKIDRDSAAGRGLTSGPEIMRRDPQIQNKITENEFVDYHFQDGPRRTRKKQNPEDAIAMQIASELGFEYLKQDFSNKGPIFQKFSEVGDLLDVVIPDAANVQVIKDIDRGVVKFSMDTKGDGTWVPDLLNPLSGNKSYNFNVADTLFRISLFENEDFDYEILELTEGFAEDTFINDPKSMAIAFRDLKDDSTEITGRIGAKDSVKVFSIVANSVLDIIKKDDLNSVTFTAKEKNRQSLYQAMVFKFQKELGWESYSFPTEGEIAFVVYNPKLIETAEKNKFSDNIKFSKNLSNAMGLVGENIFTYKNFNDVNLGRIGLVELSEKMVAKFGIEEWVNIIDPLIAKQYKPKKDDRGIDVAIDFAVTEEKFKKYEGIFFKRTKVDGEYRTAQFLTLGRNDYYEVILAKAIGKNVKWDGKNLIINNEIIKRPTVPPQRPTSKGKKYPGFSDKKGWDSTMEERINFATSQKEGFRKIVEILTEIYNASNKTRNDIAKIGMVLNSFNSSTNALVRTAAIPGLEMRMIGLKDSEYRYEHTQPASETLRQIGRLIVGAKNAQSFDEIMENFRVAIIPKVYDKIINKTKADGKYLKSNSPLDKNGNLKKPDDSTLPTRYVAAAKNISKAGLEPLVLIDNYNADSDLKFSKSLSREFNKILQDTKNVDWYKKFEPEEARTMGRGKGKRKFFVPYSADDFVGLLYATLGKREVGEKQMQWYEENLLRPFSKGIQQYEAAKQNTLAKWSILKKEAKKDVPAGLNKRNETGLRNQDALRVYIWSKQGMEIPGLSNKRKSDLLNVINNNEKLKLFGEKLINLNAEGYPAPTNNWDSGDITTDLVGYLNDVKRAEYLTQWQENVNEIFSDINKNKLRALYGDSYIESLENILERMKTGRNRTGQSDRQTNRWLEWLNNSVGSIMFFNTRSALLQQLSVINFINFSDNNPINAAKAFANQKQYWDDFTTLFNSNFLKQRRSGLQNDINADEIARAAATSTNKARAVLSAILKAGFIPTQIGDSFAIASGGASFYRNRIKKYLKEGLEQSEAEAKAFTDFQEIAEETQQSARPDRVSKQQASPLGRVVLAFQNVTMQYARLMKKATLDLINGRGDWKTNISKILYYGVIQNIIFNGLQQGLFALIFDDEEDEQEKNRYMRVGNGVLDSFLRGAGIYGAAVSTAKNVILETINQAKASRPDYTKAAIKAVSLSPPIDIKLRKLMKAGKTFTYKQSREKVFTEGISLENPAFMAAGSVMSSVANLPADRIVQKATNIKAALESETELWQSIALAMGWNEWDLGMIERQTKEDNKRRIRTRTRNRTRSRN